MAKTATPAVATAAPLNGFAPAPMLPPVRNRRRPLAAAGIGLSLFVIGGLATAALVVSSGHKSAVIVVTHTVARGDVIGRGDLGVTSVGLGSGVTSVPAAQLASMIGLRAKADLTAGALLTPGTVTSELLPAKGQSVVGIALKANQLPSVDLMPGDRVGIVLTPKADDDAPLTAPDPVIATVVSVTKSDSSDLTTVNVTAADENARMLASMVATGRVALVLNSRAH